MPLNKRDRKARRLVKSAIFGRPWLMEASAFGRLIETAIHDPREIRSQLGVTSEYPVQTKVVSGVAVIPVCGVLVDAADPIGIRYFGECSYQLIERDFRLAMEDGQVKAVMFYHSSPGGSAVGASRAADTIFSARGRKPMLSYMHDLSASADYYLAAAADRIVANRDAMVGSVGTIYHHAEYSGFLEDAGITVTTLTHGEHKGDGNPYEKLSPAAKATLQRFIDSYGEPFVEDVAKFRGITVAEVQAKFGQGQPFRADRTVALGMVDEIVSGFDEAIAMARSMPNKHDPMKQKTTVVSGEAAVQPRPPQIFSRKESEMNPKIKAWLYANDLIDSLDISDEVATAALKATFKGRGQAMPKDDTAILAALSAVPQAVAAKPVEADPVKPASNVEDAHKKEFDEARQAGVASERERLADIEAAAALLNFGRDKPVITQEMVAQSHRDGKTAKQATEDWLKILAEKEKPAETIEVTGEGSQRFVADASQALFMRCAESLVNSELPGSRRSVEAQNALRESLKNTPDDVARLSAAPLIHFAKQCLVAAGARVSDMATNEEIAEAAMKMGDHSKQAFFSPREKRMPGVQMTTPFNRPGDFPNLLSNLANKIMDAAIELADPSYPEWTAVYPGGLPDFKPAPIIGKGMAEELDEVMDAEVFKEVTLSEEVLSYLFLRRFGNSFGWTPVMVANDDMGAFTEGMIGLGEAWEFTINRLCLSILTGNVALLDGFALFDNTNHSNDRASGGVPSDAEWAAMEEGMADQTGIGMTRRIRGTLNTILLPTGTQHQAARRTFETIIPGENKYATADSGVGLYRGRVRIVPEPELRGDTVATRYYGFNNPTMFNRATVIRAYFRGFGQMGRRERWYDPENKCVWISLEGRVGAAAKNYRYAIRNKGAA